MHAKGVIYQIWVSIMICMCRVNTLLLVDVFQSFSNISTEIYELDPACLSLKETKPDLTIITNYMILTVEKGIRSGKSHAIH